MKRIHLSGGGEAIVDDAVYPLLMRWKWKRHRQGYAFRTTTGNTAVLMHRQIMGDPPGREVDHRNQNKLDNRRRNLRLAEHWQNGHNRPKQRNNTSGFKGVSWDKARGKWAARMQVNGVYVHIGRFDRIEDAVAAYRAKGRELVGEFHSC